MSKKPKLSDVPGIGPKMEEKLRDAGVKTPLKLSRADPAKLAAKIDGLSEKRAATLIEAAKGLIQAAEEGPAKEEKPKKAAPKKKPVEKEAKAEKPKAAPKKKAAEKPKKAPKKEPGPKPPKKETPKKKPEPEPPKKKAPKKKPPKKKKTEKPKKVTKKKEEPLTHDTLVEPRIWKLTQYKKRRQPKFVHEQAHRWIRVKKSWRKVRGIDNPARQKKKGRAILVSAGYRKPRSARGIHPSRYLEVLVYKPEDLDGLNPDLHAIRIGGTVGNRKRQAILNKADSMLLRVLNPGVPEFVEEEELFEELEGLEDLEVD